METHLALNDAPYTKITLGDPKFIEDVRAGTAGCAVRRHYEGGHDDRYVLRCSIGTARS